MTAEAGREEDELFIRLDVAGLAMLLEAVEAAMVDGRGHLTLSSGCGMAVTSSLPSYRFGKVIVKFARPKDRGHATAAPPTPAELVPA